MRKPIRMFLATNLERDEAGGMRWRIGLDHIEAGYEDIRGEPAGEGAYAGAKPIAPRRSLALCER